MKISSITADQSDDGFNSSDEKFAEETMCLSSDSESCWSLLDSFPAFWLSLVNLENEDSKLIPDGDFDFDWFQSSFPSPSFRSGFIFEVKLAGSAAIEDVDRDEPIFWPLELQIDWKSMEDWDWFSISPRKINLNQAPKGRLVFNSRSAASEMMELKHRRDAKTTVPRIGAVPSRFNRATKNSGEKHSDEKLLAVDRDFLEKDLLASEEIPIETLLGLREFDGREGFGLEFDDVVLSLDEV